MCLLSDRKSADVNKCNMADFLLLAAFAVIGFIVFRVLHFASLETKPDLYHTDSKFIRNIINACSLLTKPYIPPFLWGKSGHIQTVLYAKLGRVQPPLPRGERASTLMQDGAMVTFDIFHRLVEHPTKGDYTMLICPGIANSSESLYIRNLVHYAQNSGFRVAVLNHLGALKDVPLTAPRIYTYGGTDEYSEMVDYVLNHYPSTKLIAVGCSMGGNIITKYLGEDCKRQEEFICALSVCQGYDVNKCLPYLMSWEHLRRGYNFMMARNQVYILSRHADALFNEKTLRDYNIDKAETLASTSLHHIDELYSRRRAGFANIKDYYDWCSSSNWIDNIDIPILILNAQDDPIVPDALFSTPWEYVATHEKALFVVTKHGGHLGFFEGQEKNWLLPQQVTWLDKIVLEYANAVIKVTQQD